MPRTSNSYKKISAQKRNETALQAAFNVKVPILFARVEACLGNAQFRLVTANGSTVNGTPLGLFTRATMPINPGQIVLSAGLLGVEKDQEDAFEFEAEADSESKGDEEVDINAI